MVEQGFLTQYNPQEKQNSKNNHIYNKNTNTFKYHERAHSQPQIKPPQKINHYNNNHKNTNSNNNNDYVKKQNFYNK